MPPDLLPPGHEPAKREGRYALGLWFVALAVLGGVRFVGKYRASAGPALTLDAWLWLAGSCVCCLVGLMLIVRAWRRPL